MGTFALACQDFADRFGDYADQVVFVAVLEFRSRLIVRSPVGNPSTWREPRRGYVGGHFRKNWQTETGVLTSIELEGVGAPPAPNVDQQAAGKVHYISNPVPYARRLEYGWSKQAPNGMVALTAIEWPNIVADAAAAVTE
jgi:hypothetical protein